MMVFRKISSWGDYFSDALAIFFLAAILWLMVFGSYKLWRIISKNTLSLEKNIQNYGELYEAQLRDRPSYYQLYYNIFFMFRRLFATLCIFYMKSLPNFQIGIQIWICVLWIGYTISERPFYDPSLNHVEAANNIFYWFLLVFCFGLTSAIDDKSTRNILGYIFIVLIVILISANATFMLVGVVNKVFLKAKQIIIHYRVK